VIIHSVTPVHFLLEQSEGPTMNMHRINGGYLEGRHTPQGFQASRLHSTDPALYLKNEYAPGSILRSGEHY